MVRSIVASFEAVPNGKLNYRHIEFDKISALQQNKGNFEGKCYLPPTAIAELKLWKENILQVYRELKSLPDVDNTVHTDANTEGWRAHRTCSLKKASFWRFYDILFICYNVIQNLIMNTTLNTAIYMFVQLKYQTWIIL